MVVSFFSELVECDAFGSKQSSLSTIPTDVERGELRSGLLVHDYKYNN